MRRVRGSAVTVNDHACHVFSFTECFNNLIIIGNKTSRVSCVGIRTILAYTRSALKSFFLNAHRLHCTAISTCIPRSGLGSAPLGLYNSKNDLAAGCELII